MESNNATVLNEIPFELNLEQLQRKLHVEKNSHFEADLAEIIQTAQKIARPKAFYKVSYIQSKTENTVVIDGISFTSRVLRVNLNSVHRVFAFVATCGTELEQWAASIDDVLHQFWVDTIKECTLREAICYLKEHLDQTYQLKKTSSMSPGSLKDWPIEEQTQLFQLLGDTKQQIGVELTPSFLMLPTKSVSGFRFPAEDNFESCQLCPREDCPGRRMPYDPELFQKKYEMSPH